MSAHTEHPDVIKRLKRAAGHLQSIIVMLEEDRHCLDIAQQLQAVENAIGNAKKVLVHDHIDHCLEQAVRDKHKVRKTPSASSKPLPNICRNNFLEIVMTEFTTLLQQGNAWLFIPSAILLGALHGLEPGHSKTMMAAFIVAVRGTVGQAVLLGLSATFSHTLVVWAIALAGMYFGATGLQKLRSRTFKLFLQY